MGLSSSQARLLTLTARMHQIEYKAAKVEAMKLQMANESREAYDEYLDALDKTKIQRKTIQSDGTATFVDVSSLQDLKDAGVYLYDMKAGKYVDTNGSITIDNEVITINSESIANLINSGQFVLVTKNTDTPTAEQFTSVSTNTNLQEVADEIDIRKAEAKYEANMRRIDAKDRKYDTDLAALDNERNAIKQEMETLKTVAKDNVERTFKLFS
jgi:hypothetical protein